jgi:hypothetical protein
MSAPRIERLTLIWNADSGVLAILADVAKKLAGVESCELCAITHAATGEKKEWRECRSSLGVPVKALHRDEVPAALSSLVASKLPCVVAHLDDGRDEILVDAETITRCHGDPEAFRDAIRARASEAGRSLG